MDFVIDFLFFLWNSEKVKINPLMYKQFLIRFPDQSIPLTMQIIDSVNNAESKVFKKTSALITLNQTVNNQMFSKSSEEQTKSFTAKMFSFLELVNYFTYFMIYQKFHLFNLI